MTIDAWVGFVIAALILIIVGLSAGVSIGDGKAAPQSPGLYAE